MVDRFEMRAADSDRERIAEILREAHGEGRLNQDEFLARVDATYAARTYLDLDRQIADLPLPRRPMTGLARPFSTTPTVRRQTGRRVVRGMLTTAWWIYACVVAINVMAWLLVSVGNGAAGYPWPIWVAGPWGVLLGFAEAGYRARASRQ